MFNLPPPPHFRGLDEHLPLRVYFRNLPHWRQEGATYFVTFRLADALPQIKIRELQTFRQEWTRAHPPPRNNQDWEDYAKRLFQQAEQWLDHGFGECYLARPNLAKILADALLFFQDTRYFLSCYTIMPNHCHLVVEPFPGHPLEKILQGWKGYAAYQINQALGRTGSLWQDESFDRIVRDEEHLYRVIQYLGRNPGQAGLAPERWVRWLHPVWAAAGWGFLDPTEEFGSANNG